MIRLSALTQKAHLSLLKFGDGDGQNLCRVKKSSSSTFIENIFRSGLTLVSS